MKVELLNVENFAKQFKNIPKSKVIELLYQALGENLEVSNNNSKLQFCWNELKKWVLEQEQKAWDEVSSTFGYVLEKMQELEG